MGRLNTMADSYQAIVASATYRPANELLSLAGSGAGGAWAGENPQWPESGIFAQRGKNRPNRIGNTICRILRREGRTLVVAELDAINGTPVLDIKPVMREFLPRDEVRQPTWSHELMRSYWAKTP
jgi:tRNA (Thr-GGU) A37 N-methylase